MPMRRRSPRRRSSSRRARDRRDRRRRPGPGAGDPSATHDHASSPTTRSRSRRRCLREFTRADRRHGEGPPGRRRGRRAQPGDPHQGRPDRRRVLRRRQHVPHARARRRHLRAGTRRGARRRAAECQLDPSHRAHARSTTATCASTTTSSGSQSTTLAGPDDARRPRQARVPGPARRREPGDVVARPRVPAGDHRPVRRRRMARLLGEAPRQRRQGRRRLGAGVQRRRSRGRRARATGRSSSRTRRARPRRSTSPNAAAEDVADRHVLDTCFRQVEFAGVLRAPSTSAAARKLVDFMLSEPVPGRHPAPDVRVPRA